MKELIEIEKNLNSIIDDFEDGKILKYLAEVKGLVDENFEKIREIIKEKKLIRCKLNWKIMKQEDHNCKNCSYKCEIVI